MIYFTADSHVKHVNILRLSKRPFSDIHEMDRALIDNWNSVVKPEDDIYHLGDVSLSKDWVALDRIFKQLNGNKYLIPGNHDKWLKYQRLHQYWTILPTLFEKYFDDPLTGKQQKIVMCHFPILSWNGAFRNAWMLHGHCHGSLNYMNTNTKRLDVGVDAVPNKYFPISYQEVKQLMDAKQFTAVDHHETDM